MRAVVGGIGRACITVGILILLFVGYQLWGTGIYEARAQDDLRNEFDAQLEAAASTTTTAPGATTTTVPGTPPSSAAGTTAISPPPPAEGDPVGIIRIPKIGLDRVVVEGTSVPDLRMGPGHYPGTPLPGQLGNSAIAGHRTTYGAPFNRLDELEAGDLIELETVQGKFKYKVTEQQVVSPSQTEVLDPTPNAATLTLTTCNPKYSAAQRLVVKAELKLKDDEQPLPPAEGSGEATDLGLSGSRESRVPVVLWGLLTAIVGGVWWLAFHRYSRWPAWIAGLLPFLVVLFVFYVYLERMLPSNY
ncbi:MAG: class E sortase [Acidimicrobiia bacterium]